MEKSMCDVIAKYHQTQKNQAAAIGNGEALATCNEDTVLLPASILTSLRSLEPMETSKTFAASYRRSPPQRELPVYDELAQLCRL